MVLPTQEIWRISIGPVDIEIIGLTGIAKERCSSSDVATGGTCLQAQSCQVMGIAEIRGEKLGAGWGYRIIFAKHRDEYCLHSELGQQSQSASVLTAVHRSTLRMR